jgi:predicted nucleic acid-binding protein
VVTLGEIEFGLELARLNGLATPQLQAVVAKARVMPLCDITRHTARYYSEIKATVAKKFLPKRSKLGNKRLPRWPTQWVDEFSGELLQVDENDLWIAAQALEKNLVLLTTDEGMRRIWEAVPSLRVWHI